MNDHRAENGVTRPTCYRFDDFTLSPARRVLLQGGAEIPLIPRYFDLLVLLVERRGEAVTRNEIFDVVWNDVIVTDGALTQAVRILRKSLGDRPKDPVYIRTVSRHGYRFIYEAVEEAPDDDVRERELVSKDGKPEDSSDGGETSLRQAIELLSRATLPATEDEEAGLREAAETVHRLGGSDTVAALSRDSDIARALLRESRWALPESTAVPLLGSGGSLSSIVALVKLRLRMARSVARKRRNGAVVGGALAGLAGGVIGGLVLRLGPGSTATNSVLVALPLVGLVVGGLGAAGVGTGMVWAEAVVRSHRSAALVALGALGGGFVGAVSHFVGWYTIEGLFGRDLSPIGGGFEGFVLGGAVGLGYALVTPVAGGGMATPRGGKRWRSALLAGFVTALAAALLAVTDHHLGAMSLDFMAKSFPGSQVSLEPLARLLGDSSAGQLTAAAISAFEGLLFGFGVVFGLTRRPRQAR